MKSPRNRSPLQQPPPAQEEPACAISSCLVTRHGRTFAISHTVSPILNRSEQAVGTVVVFRDISREQTMARQLRWQAHHDGLTGLINRTEFEARLTNLITQTPAYSQEPNHMVGYLDLDRFKIVNDTCGHLAGDELLRQIGHLLEKHARPSDVMARLGGDEFGILWPNCTPEQGEMAAQKICQAIHGFRFEWQDTMFTIGASIGLTAISTQVSITEVLRQADTACYWAKHRGRNQICRYDAMEEGESPTASASIVTQLNKALSQNLFRLYGQTIQPIGLPPMPQPHLEILLRMQDAQGRMLSPAAFIPTAERYNLMIDLDRWVIRTLFQQHDAWVNCHFIIKLGLKTVFEK